MPSILTALRALLFASGLSLLLLIGGCGLKGDLVLPEPASAGSDAEDPTPDDERTDDGASPQ